MSLDITAVVQPILAAAGAVIAGLAAVYVPKAIQAFQDRTGIILTENQRQTVKGAVDTAAGMLETALDKGAAKVEHIEVGTLQVTQQAQAVINAVPTAFAALGLTINGVARMIVGAVDTSAHTAPVPSSQVMQAAQAMEIKRAMDATGPGNVASSVAPAGRGA